MFLYFGITVTYQRFIYLFLTMCLYVIYIFVKYYKLLRNSELNKIQNIHLQKC